MDCIRKIVQKNKGGSLPLRSILGHIGYYGEDVRARDIDISTEQVKEGRNNDGFDWKCFPGIT